MIDNQNTPSNNPELLPGIEFGPDMLARRTEVAEGVALVMAATVEAAAEEKDAHGLAA